MYAVTMPTMPHPKKCIQADGEDSTYSSQRAIMKNPVRASPKLTLREAVTAARHTFRVRLGSFVDVVKMRTRIWRDVKTSSFCTCTGYSLELSRVRTIRWHTRLKNYL